MSNRTASAERCLVAACAHLSMMTVRNENFPMWVSIIRDVLPDCEGCASAMAQLKAAADVLASAERGRPQDNAMTRLRWETERYFALAAAHRFEAWKQAKSEGQRT
ncbi:hypothetical protein [Thalassovita sp.]|uniref:hypothetical protein n=1 Tax=Thalassovita sp. TaxID=1979401 RepID=UPI003B5C2B31